MKPHRKVRRREVHPWRWWLPLLGAILGVLVGLPFLLFEYFSSEAYIRERVLPRMKSDLGIVCDADTVEASLEEGLVLTGVTLRPSGQLSYPPPIKVDRVRVDLYWPALIHRRLRIRSIEVEGFQGEPLLLATAVREAGRLRKGTGPGKIPIDAWRIARSDLIFPAGASDSLHVHVDEAEGTISDPGGVAVFLGSSWRVGPVALEGPSSERLLLAEGTLTEKGFLNRITGHYETDWSVEDGEGLDVSGKVLRPSNEDGSIRVTVLNGSLPVGEDGVGALIPGVRGFACFSAEADNREGGWEVHGEGDIENPSLDLPTADLSAWRFADLHFHTTVRWTENQSPAGSLALEVSVDPPESLHLPSCTLVAEATGESTNLEWSLAMHRSADQSLLATLRGGFSGAGDQSVVVGRFHVDSELSEVRTIFADSYPLPATAGDLICDGTFSSSPSGLDVDWKARSPGITVDTSSAAEPIRLLGNSVTGTAEIRSGELRRIDLDGQVVAIKMAMGGFPIKPISDTRFSLSGHRDPTTGRFEITSAEAEFPFATLKSERIDPESVLFYTEGRIESVLELLNVKTVPQMRGAFVMDGRWEHNTEGSSFILSASSEDFEGSIPDPEIRFVGPVSADYRGIVPLSSASRLTIGSKKMRVERRGGSETVCLDLSDLSGDVRPSSTWPGSGGKPVFQVAGSAECTTLERKTPDGGWRVVGPLRAEYEASLPLKTDWRIGLNGESLRYDKTSGSKTDSYSPVSVLAALSGADGGKSVKIEDGRILGPGFDLSLNGTVIPGKESEWLVDADGKLRLDDLPGWRSSSSRPQGDLRFVGRAASAVGKTRGRFRVDSERLVFPKSVSESADGGSTWILPDWDVELFFGGDEIDYKGIIAKDLSCDALLRDRRLRIDSCEFQVGDGTVSGTAEIDLSHPERPYAGVANLKEVALIDLLEPFSPGIEEKVGGKLRGTLSWSGRDAAEEPFFANLQAQTVGDLLLHDGYFKRNKTASLIAKILNVDEYDNLEIQEATGSMSLAAGRVTIDDLKTATNQGRIDLRGSVGLDRTQDLTIDIYVPISLAGRIPGLDLLRSPEKPSGNGESEGSGKKREGIMATISAVGRSISELPRAIPHYEAVRRALKRGVKVTIRVKGTFDNPEVGPPDFHVIDGLGNAADSISSSIKKILP